MIRSPRGPAPRSPTPAPTTLAPWLAVVGALLVLAACAGEITSPGEPLRLLSPALPAAFEGEPYEATLRPTGGLRPYTYTLVDGALPPGIRLEAGRLLGSPSAQGRFTFTVELSDANLNRTVQRLELSVRPLPDPVISVDVPPTELQRATELRLRLDAGRNWRGAEVLVTWDAERFELRSDSVRTANRDVIAIWEVGPGHLRVDVAALGEPLSRAADLVRFTLEPREPARLGLSVTAASVTTAGRTLDTRRLGAPIARPDAVTEDAFEVDEADNDEADNDEADNDEADNGLAEPGEAPVDQPGAAVDENAPDDEPTDAPHDDAPDDEEIE